MEDTRKSGRWLMVAAATLLMVCLGTVYAWSYFQTPLMSAYGWNNAQVSLTFSLAIFFLGLAAAIGGMLLPTAGPRKLAVWGSVFFGLGFVVTSLALSSKSLFLLYLGYGAIGGTGLGLGYVTPVATIAKWFPDRKGLATGIVIMGFGFGALFMSKILAPLLLSATGGNLPALFLTFAAVFLALTVPSSFALKMPPAQGKGAKAAKGKGMSAAFAEAKGDMLSLKFFLVWFMFFCNITAGIAVIGFQSPMFQELERKFLPAMTPEALAAGGATLIAITSLFNGFGRFFWGAVSDKAGRIRTFMIMLGTEIIVFGALIFTGNPWIFAALACWVLLCYGGGFGTMPATISEMFGADKMTALYGVVLTAWAAGGIVGPLITATIKDRIPQRASTLSFAVGTGFVALGFALSLLLNRMTKAKKA